jgi:hypothetical protein
MNIAGDVCRKDRQVSLCRAWFIKDIEEVVSGMGSVAVFRPLVGERLR